MRSPSRTRSSASSIYSARVDVRDAFAQRLAVHDTGKGCLRFWNPAWIDYDLVRDLLRATVATRGQIC
ncbi:hypothetical protein [Nocardia sp. NPDC051463]|uniref:hypothetical protein n=1 Tax=Nocardia sp. NPDC051463 TaxID=3154845 RepID=UPI003449FF72